MTEIMCPMNRKALAAGVPMNRKALAAGVPMSRKALAAGLRAFSDLVNRAICSCSLNQKLMRVGVVGLDVGPAASALPLNWNGGCSR
jgi:hypothetical protein